LNNWLAQRPLSVKIALASLLLTLVGVISMALIAYHFADGVLQQEALHALRQSVAREMLILKGKLQTVENDALFMSISPPIQGLNRAMDSEGFDDRDNMTQEMWRLRLESLFTTVLKQRAMYDQIRLIGIANQGKELVRVERLGRNIHTVSAEQLQTKSNRDYFRESLHLSPDALYFSEITLNREHGAITFPPRTMLRVIAPVFNSKHQLFALLAININLHQLIPVLKLNNHNHLFFVINERGDYLIHPDKDKEMAFEYGRKSDLLSDYPKLLPLMQQMAPGGSNHTPVSLILAHKDIAVSLHHVHFDPRHEQRFLAIGAVEPLSQLRATSLALRNQLLLIVVAITLLLTLTTFLLTRRVTLPIQQLTAAVKRIGIGEKGVEIPIQGGDEIAMLGAAFADLLCHLETSQKTIKDANTILETKVNQRTYELEMAKRELESRNSELTHALQQAEQAAKTKGQFLATMSHEIRTPLNGVLGLTELLLDSELSDAQRDQLTTVRESGQTLLIILNDILDLSKMEAGQFTLNKSEFSPNSLVEHIIKLYIRQVQQKDIELIGATIPTLTHQVIGDPDRLRQILMNLLSNAIKFTDSGEVMLAVKALHEDDDQITLQFTVSDSGIGINPEDQGKLFDAFSQVDGSSTRKYGGTGLGLSIARRLAALMGGDIQLESHKGEGSRFWFEITLAKGAPLVNSVLYHQAQLKQWRVLVVDDNATNRMVLHHMLAGWGMQSSAVEGGRQALQQLQQAVDEGDPFDLALLDHAMPEMDGLELAQRIKSQTALALLKLIMLSSLDGLYDCTQKEAHGLDGCLRKPLCQSTLYNLILSVMGAERTATATTIRQVITRNERVLLAEDVKVNQQVAIGMLKKIGLTHVDIVNNGSEAVQQFACGKYALILMDLQMPEMDGYTATGKIRQIEQAAEKPCRTPIIALTAHALDEEKERSYHKGMDDLITKPLTGEKLATVIQHWLPDSRGDAQQAKVATLDREALQRLHQDMGGSIGPILTAFVDELSQQIDGLCLTLQHDDREPLQHFAHRLKGSCRNIGALALGEICAQLEQQAKEGEAIASATMVQTLHDEQKRLIAALNAPWVDALR